MIDLRGVSCGFPTRNGRMEALRDIDLHIPEHQFVAVIGRSGCGKSTLLRLIAGLLRPASGRITIAGTPVREPRREVALMHQRPALLPWRTALTNVMLPAEILHLPRQEYRARAAELLDSVGLAGFHDSLFAALKRLGFLGCGQFDRAIDQRQRGSTIFSHGQEKLGSANSPGRDRGPELNLGRLFPAEEVGGPGLEFQLRFLAGLLRRLNFNARQLVHPHHAVHRRWSA